MGRALIVGVACAVLSSTAVSLADLGLRDDSSQSIYIVATSPAPLAASRFAKTTDGARARAINLVAEEARRQGVDPDVALRIANLESGFNANARNRKTGASGLLQLMPASAEALEPGSSRLLFDPSVNARVGVRHMVRCMEAGATTGDEIARCHVAGWRGWNRKLKRWAERYKHQYVAMFRKQSAPDDKTAGWLARGAGSLNVASLFSAS